LNARHPYGRLAYCEALAAAAGEAACDAPEWASAVVRRPIAGGGADAAGPYPRTPLTPEADLAGGLERLRDLGLVSVVLVPDPLIAPDAAALAAAFPVCRPFKRHLVIDRRIGPYAPSKHHRYEMRRAQQRCDVEVVALAQHLDDWTRLYAGLAQRHEIAGPAAFSAAYFALMAADPSYEVFAARAGGEIVAMAIWFRHAGVAVNHLGASDAAGYAVGASYALYDAAIQRYGECERIDLGGAAGLAEAADDGLSRFKRGFANAEATAFVCGAVLDEAAYARLAAGRSGDGFFPAYRR